MWVPEKVIHRVPVLLFLVDVCLVGLVFFFAYDYRFSGPFLDPRATEHSADHRLLGIAAIVFWPPALHLLNLYNPSRFRLGLKLLMRIAQAGLIAAILTATVIFALNATQVSRIVFGILFVGSGVALWGARVALSALLMQVTAGLRVVVIGTGPVAKRFVDIMTEQGEADSSVLGHFDIGEPDPSVDDGTIIGPIDQLTDTLEHEVVDRVVLAVPMEHINDLDEAFGCCQELGIDVVMVPDYVPRLMSHAVPGLLFGTPVLRLDASPQFRAVMAAKRLFDILVAACLLVVSTPWLIGLGVVIRATSKGSALFVQDRLSLNGRRFKLYKLRTMWEGAHLRQDELAHLNEIDGPAFKIHDDPRVTPLGRVLRRYSLDELPQLVNVIKGEMSLVGPRPPLPAEVSQYSRPDRRRLSIKPGMTGHWQVEGRSRPEFDKRVAFDLAYIDNWSPWLDAKILAKTLPAIWRDARNR